MPKNNFRLDIELDNGNSITLNLENRLKTIRFGVLRDEELFKRATTDGTCISWEGKVEISLSEVFQLMQK
jgi:hypothetical protein